MKACVSIKVSNSTSFDELVKLLHDDYQFIRGHGYLGTPFEYVRSAVRTFPMILKFVNHENICKALNKCHKDENVFAKCQYGTYILVNGIPLFSHYYNIILALNNILINGIELKFKEGDILYCKKSGGILFVLKNNTDTPCYRVKRLADERLESYDIEALEENFKKIGVVES